LSCANLVDYAEFDVVGGLDTVLVFLNELLEGSGIFAVEEEAFGKQAVAQSVLRGTLFPFGGDRPVGLGAVGARRFFSSL